MFGDPIDNEKKWPFELLPDVTTIVLGSTPKTKNEEYWNGNIKWISPAELTDNSFYVYDTVKHITEAGVKSAGLKSFPANTVLFSTRAPIGKTAIAGCEMYCNQGFKNFICSSRLNPVYLYYLLKMKKEYFQGLGSGTTFRELSRAAIEKISIAVPDIALQNRFELLFKQSDKSKFIKFKSQFIEMFSVEKGWPLVKLETLCDSIVRGPFGSALKVSFFVEKGTDTVKVYEQKNAIQRSADLGDSYVTQEKYQELKRFSCGPGDFIMSCSGTIGCLYQIPDGAEPGIINQALCKFHLNGKMLPEVFLVYMRNSVDQLETKGSAIKNIGAVSYIKHMEIALPPIDVQEQFAEFLNQSDKSK